MLSRSCDIIILAAVGPLAIPTFNIESGDAGGGRGTDDGVFHGDYTQQHYGRFLESILNPRVSPFHKYAIMDLFYPNVWLVPLVRVRGTLSLSNRIETNSAIACMTEQKYTMQFIQFA